MKHISSLFAIILSLLIPPNIQATPVEINHSVSNNLLSKNTFILEQANYLISSYENDLLNASDRTTLADTQNKPNQIDKSEELFVKYVSNSNEYDFDLKNIATPLTCADTELLFWNEKEVVAAGKVGIIPQLTKESMSHISSGSITITVVDSSSGLIISKNIRKVTDVPFNVPTKGVNIQVNTSGMHFKSILKPGLVEEIEGASKLVTTLISGEKVYKSNIKVFIQEGNNGQGIWQTVKDKTWWPIEWSEEKIWSKISEAYKNKILSPGTSRWIGKTQDGVSIEMYLDDLNNILTAYVVP